MNERELAKYYAGGRVAIGALMLLFPGLFMRDILGARDRRTKAVGRMLGVRDALLGVGALVALEEEKARVRPWMTYAAIADSVDALSFLLAWKQLPKWRRALFFLFAAGGAGTGGYLVSKIDD